MAQSGVQLAKNILCHCWNSDCSQVALCPHNNEVHIFSAPEEADAPWSKVHVLKGHDQLVSGIDWSLSSNLIVTVSHDRNAYVWTYDGSAWQPQMVLTRLHRAALCVKWSPSEAKFAIGSSSKWVCICHFEKEHNWWVSKLIKKQHQSSIVSVAWHPSSTLLATASTDFKCRVINTFIPGKQSSTFLLLVPHTVAGPNCHSCFSM
jgi:actin related protein 2/3 complex subunit 1A/1B